MKPLKKLANYNTPSGPVVLVIMDGVGIGQGDAGDMVANASTPTLDWLKENALYTTLKAHGSAVGMPSDDDMGNSEVGHNAIGSGRVFDQGALLVKRAVASGEIYKGDVWQKMTGALDADNTLHFIGLLSDGNVHSHIDILLSMLTLLHRIGRWATVHHDGPLQRRLADGGTWLENACSWRRPAIRNRN